MTPMIWLCSKIGEPDNLIGFLVGSLCTNLQKSLKKRHPAGPAAPAGQSALVPTWGALPVASGATFRWVQRWLTQEIPSKKHWSLFFEGTAFGWS